MVGVAAVDPPGRAARSLCYLLPHMNSDNQSDDRVRIHIEGLEIQARIGVTDEERSVPQRLIFNITLWLGGVSPYQLEDKIERTVDYAAVCAETTRFVQARVGSPDRDARGCARGTTARAVRNRSSRD